MISKNAIALVVLALSMFGVEVVEADLIELISAVGTVISFAMMVWNQYSREDVDNFFFKK
jgi:hypothetical protein